ncbi:hypothetical protein [Kitasatospora sp. NPDC093102]|uniref:hypothetical protein n=1 Tax=Kitasatospora sp. NPDC093102 TaxID=3155069 RepID=UPI0034471F38
MRAQQALELLGGGDLEDAEDAEDGEGAAQWPNRRTRSGALPQCGQSALRCGARACNVTTPAAARSTNSTTTPAR